jgi:hypothetical protein
MPGDLIDRERPEPGSTVGRGLPWLDAAIRDPSQRACAAAPAPSVMAAWMNWLINVPIAAVLGAMAFGLYWGVVRQGAGCQGPAWPLFARCSNMAWWSGHVPG